jgi:hypothetical protein
MLPAYPLASIVFGSLAARLRGTRRTLVAAAAAFVLAFNVASWCDAQAASADGSQDAGPKLLAFLEENGLVRCYSAAPLYHLTFESTERVLLVPLQKNRYPDYDRVLEASESICYVFRDDQQQKPQHVAMMRHLAEHSVTYRSARVGPYHVLWSFSPRAVLSGDAIRRIREPRDAGASLGSVPHSEAAWT